MSRSANARRLVPIMPPLLDEETIPLSRENGNTNFGGTSCENIVKSYFLANNINVADPHVDDGVDLLIEKPEGWVRGQVKKVVYQLKLDHTHKKKFGGEIYRTRFNFNFQSGGSPLHLKNGRRQRGPHDTDYFYHVLLTPYRQLIWEIPVDLIPLRKDGNFVQGTNLVLDRDNWIRKKARTNYYELLIHSQYSPIVFKRYPEFFVNMDKPTIESFI